jgi:4-hydroxybenzoate polyprenyltransferase
MRLVTGQGNGLRRPQWVLYKKPDLCCHSLFHEAINMQDPHPLPDGQVADAVKDNWVDRWAPARARPFLRLSRADRPIGTWLLLLPCWWGLALACLADGRAGPQDLWIAAGCAAGAWLMRGAGCTWNDITDRDFDGKVERTRSRPIPSGQVGLRGAGLWMGLQALIAFGILLTFNAAAIALGILALVPVAIYPFAKRFTWWPQVFLGLAFNWGALLAFAAHYGGLHPAAVVLYLAGIFWTLFYDTIYAHQDTEDDALIGIKSTARLFGDRSPYWLGAFGVICTGLMAAAVWLAAPAGATLPRIVALFGSLAMGGHLLWQLRRLNIHSGPVLLRLFRSNRDTGLIVLFFFVASLML